MEARLSPSYYQALRGSEIRSSFLKKRLSSLVDTFSGGTPSKNNPQYWQGNIGWISPKDIKGFYIHTAEDFISQAAIIDSSTKIAPKGSIVIVARSGILAHTLPVSILSNDFAINQDIKAVLTRDDNIIPEYLAVFLTIFQKRLLPIITKHSTTVQSVNSPDFLRLEIVCPPLNVQREIINLFKKALIQKSVQEETVSTLLQGTDSFLLNALGVKLPPEPDNGIENRMFKTSWQQVSGGRFDPKRYSKGTKSLIESIAESPIEKLTLKSLITHSVAGDWGFDPEEKLDTRLYEKRLVIRATEFDNDFNLDLEGSRVKYRTLSKFKINKLDLQLNDLLVEKSGGSPDQPVGRIAILEPSVFSIEPLAFSNFVQKFRVDEQRVLPGYLFNFLKTIHNIKLTDAMQSQTNGIRNLIMREYWNQLIPLPGIDIQRKLTEYINDIRQRAQALRQQSQRDFAVAKQEIERLILG